MAVLSLIKLICGCQRYYSCRARGPTAGFACKQGLSLMPLFDLMV